jgi:lipid II:glycine glycyltransferase (peptidoglycan interpeptide bridge formation enzyme)
MINDLKIVNPINLPYWDEQVINFPDYSFFHSSAWLKVLVDTYGYKPEFFILENEGKISSIMPLVLINSIITGRRAVALPFSDYCEPLFSNKETFINVFDEVLNYGQKNGLKDFELRGGSRFLSDSDISTFDYNHILDLSIGDEQLNKNLSSNTKRNIKKANREGVTVEISNKLSAVEIFYEMNCSTRKKHGLPPQPKMFFVNLYNHVISKDKGFISLAKHGGKNIAGAVYLHIGEKALYKYGASYMQFQNLRANNNVMWEAIKYYANKGYKSFCFGRTEPENEGLRRFKLGWGTEESKLNIHRYKFSSRSFLPIKTKTTGFHNKFFENAPAPILKLFGSLLYKHFG